MNDIDLSLLPPDLVIVIVTMTFLQLLEVTQRKYFGPAFKSYSTLTFRDRFEWDRRAINIIFQTLQVIFNSYILLYDPYSTSDVLYGYSPIAHIGFLIIVTFYVYDATGIVMHPSPSSSSIAWLIHHFITVGLLVFDVSYKKCSAFPAAVFLISSVGHIPNETRWFLAVTNIHNIFIIRSIHLVCGFVALVTCGFPPPYLLIRVATQLQITVFDVVFYRMRGYCMFFFLLIYIPHVIIIFVQFKRIFSEWNERPKAFRHRKVE